MGRPSLQAEGGESHVRGVRLPNRLYDDAVTQARELGLSFSDLVRDLLTRALASARRPPIPKREAPPPPRPAPPAPRAAPSPPRAAPPPPRKRPPVPMVPGRLVELEDVDVPDV